MGVLREESGFTVPEVLVVATMMVVVLFALYSIFNASIRVLSFANDNKVEAMENTRLGLEKMEREIRAAYPYDKPAGGTHSHAMEPWLFSERRDPAARPHLLRQRPGFNLKIEGPPPPLHRTRTRS